MFIDYSISGFLVSVILAVTMGSVGHGKDISEEKSQVYWRLSDER
jgi:hypothetical protein